jgi:ABC-type transport system involved in multi-copper enzyme maturation permease subunit
MSQDLRLFRRMRGLFWGLLVVGVVLVPVLLALGVTVPALLGLYSDKSVHDIGGPDSVARGTLGVLATMVGLAAVVLGATAGSVDLQCGVLRDLVLAGRSRARVILGRVAGAVTWLALAALLAGVITVLVAATIAPVEGTLEWGTVGQLAATHVPEALTTLLFATGVALLLGSRGMAIAVYFVFALVIDIILLAIPKVGDWWEHASYAAANSQVAAWIGDSHESFERSNGQAALVLAAWAVIPLALGLLRLQRRDL